MALIFKVIAWLLDFLPEDTMREGVLHLVHLFWADGVQEGGNVVAVCMSFVAYYLPVETLFECFKLISTCVGAALMLCIGKLAYKWIVALFDLFTGMYDAVKSSLIKFGG